MLTTEYMQRKTHRKSRNVLELNLEQYLNVFQLELEKMLQFI